LGDDVSCGTAKGVGVIWLKLAVVRVVTLYHNLAIMGRFESSMKVQHHHLDHHFDTWMMMLNK